MPHGRDGDDGSANSSLSAPPDAPSTEQYQPVYSPNHHCTAVVGHQTGGRNDNDDDLEAYHARATSFASETDGQDDDEDTLTMPVPGNVRGAVTHVVPPPPPPSSPPLQPVKHQQQQQQRRSSPAPMHDVVVSPHRFSPDAPLPLRRTPPPQPQSKPMQQQQQQQQQQRVSRDVGPPPPHVPPPPRTPPPPAAAPPPPPQPRSTIVNSGGFYYTTRPSQTTPPPTPPPPPAAAVVSLKRLTPSPTPVHLLQQQQQQQRHPSPQQQPPPQEALLLPAPYDRPPSPPTAATTTATAAVAPQPLIPHPNPSRSSSPSQWQLSSPQQRGRAGHGAVFDYASEAVNTLEQQYGDTLQRLTTMHRLYDRLDAQNHTLEEEVVRLRQVNDVLVKGVAFNVYNSVRQVKHEMKLLKQYVAVLCTGFSHSMEALQQVVAQDVPRLLERDTGYTALLPYGAQGRLHSMETRASVGRSVAQQEALSSPARLLPPWDLVAGAGGHPSGGGGGVSAAAELQVYQPDYWWNAMLPQPLRPPETSDGAADSNAAYADDGARGVPSSSEQQTSQQPQPQQVGETLQDTVSFQAYRQVQTALAEAQRRVVELERLNSNQQADFEARVAQLKVVHRAREARLAEELALLKRTEQITTEGDGMGEGPSATSSVDMNTLAQLLLHLQQQQQQQQQEDQQQQQIVQKPVTASAASTNVATNANRPRAERTTAYTRNVDEEEEAGEEEDGMVDSRDPRSSTTSSHSSHGNYHHRHRSTHRPGDDADYDFYYYGNGDPRQSYERTNRRVLQSTALGGDHPRTASGDDRRLHRPDRYTATAAARRVERARAVLGEGHRVSPTRTPPQPLAYDRLVGRHSHPADAPRGRSPRRKEVASARGGGSGGGVGLQNVDPALLQSVLEQLSHNGSGGAVTYASKASRGRGGAEGKTNAKADRLAQGLWAQEMLKERHFI